MDDFGTRLDHLSNEMCQMNTRIGQIAQRQFHLGGFVPSPKHNTSLESSTSGKDDGDASGSYYDDEMTPF